MNKLNAAKKLAHYILDDEGTHEDFRKTVISGADPKDHPFYFAHCVLNSRNVFDFWVRTFKKESSKPQEIEWYNPENLPLPAYPKRFLVKGELMTGKETFITRVKERTTAHLAGEKPNGSITYFTLAPLP